MSPITSEVIDRRPTTEQSRPHRPQWAARDRKGFTMNDFDSLIQRYLDTWNETDTDKRNALVEELWAADGRYVDPIGSAEGPAAVSALIGSVQQQFDGMRFELVGDIDAHHEQARFTWALGPAGAEPLVIGFDVLERDPAGRVRLVLGFLDKIPTA
ncbi:hypothetical protein M2284_004877 [Rhodococcus sp. LBL1]|nr:hypothetical protein [Rhodococcus sp. LBL1]MDH6686031.1 hypothetical protein [Rhodococcus sp. LBL2]